MKQIVISVSPLVKQILLSRYGGCEPIKIHRSDVVYHLLQGDPIRVNPNKNQLLRKTLTEKITLYVSPAIQKRLRGRNRQVYIGTFLHKIFQHEMISFIEAQHLAGIPAQAALKTYLQRNNISEDDYALETAYTAWKRRKTFFSKCSGSQFGKKFHRIEPTFYSPKNVPVVPRDPRNVIKAFEQFFGMPPDDCTVAQQKVLAYLIKVECQMTGNEIAKYFPVSTRSIHRYISDIRFQYGRYDDVTACIDGIMAQLRTISAAV